MQIYKFACKHVYTMHLKVAMFHNLFCCLIFTLTQYHLLPNNILIEFKFSFNLDSSKTL